MFGGYFHHTHTQTNSRIAHTVNIILLEKERKKCILNALNHSMLSSFLFLIQRRRKRSLLPLHSGTENKTHKSAFTHTNHGEKKLLISMPEPENETKN